MAAPVATARTLNGVQDTPIDSDDAPYYRAKTGVILPFGFAAAIVAQIPFVSPATRGDVSVTGFSPQGVFVGAFVKQAIRGDVVPQGFVPGLSGVSWLTLPTVQIDRTLSFPQYVTGIRSTYLVDPGGVVTSVEMIDQTVVYDPAITLFTIPGTGSIVVRRDGTIGTTVFGPPASQDWAHPKSTTVGDLFEAKMTLVSGTLSAGTVGAYLPLTSDRTWSTTGVFTGTLVIRRVGGTDLDSELMTISGS